MILARDRHTNREAAVDTAHSRAHRLGMSEQLLRDPFYGQLVASIAVTTALSDRQAESEAGVRFTDSQVKAVFHRVIKTLEGKPPKAKAPTSEKERRQHQLYDDLIALRPTILITNRETEEQSPLPVPMFLRAMRAAKESLIRNHIPEPGSRAFLERAHRTLADVEATKEGNEEAASDEAASEKA